MNADIRTIRRLRAAVMNNEATPEQVAEYDTAIARHEARRTPMPERAPGWWNLPIAAVMWRGDARDLRA